MIGYRTIRVWEFKKHGLLRRFFNWFIGWEDTCKMTSRVIRAPVVKKASTPTRKIHRVYRACDIPACCSEACAD